MQTELKKIGPRELNTIFDFMSEQIAEVIWICSNDYQSQLYTSPNFESAWGFSRNILYESREIWPTTLIVEDLKRITVTFQRRQFDDTNSAIAFRVVKPDGEISFIKDRSFGICDKHGNQVAQLGMAKIINPNEWDDLVQNDFIDTEQSSLHKVNREVKAVLGDNFGVNVLSPQEIKPLPTKNKFYILVDDQAIQLTATESKCIYYIMQSYSAKSIANILKVSVRTIEGHIQNIKTKVHCKRTLELANKIKNRSQIEKWDIPNQSFKEE